MPRRQQKILVLHEDCCITPSSKVASMQNILPTSCVTFSLWWESTLRCTIMDNARIHVAAERDFQIPDGHVWKFQPPYSPFLNICNMGLFSCWKNTLKQRLAEVREQMLNQRLRQRYDTLRQLAEESLVLITAHKCARWYAHLQTYLPRCLQNEDILM